jgi:DNA adenine methylase
MISSYWGDYDMQITTEPFVDQFARFPASRYMGSKNKIIFEIWQELKKLNFESFYDAFAGSNVVSYFLKCQGKKVITNDFMTFSYLNSKAIIENSSERLSKEDVKFLLKSNRNNGFIQKTFKNIFFSNEENIFLDRVRRNISELENEYKSALALSALVRACLKRRSRGIFTFVGERYNDGREDLKKSMERHFLENIEIFNSSVFANGQNNQAKNSPTEKLRVKADLIYLDPPYFSPKSDNDYARRYHFVEGLVKNWEGLKIQEHTAVKKFKSYVSPFSKKETVFSAFNHLCDTYKNSIIAISYSSNSYPCRDELINMLAKYKSEVKVHEIDHTYSFGNQNHKIGNLNNRVKENLFIGF